jgi:hypothetical protein
MGVRHVRYLKTTANMTAAGCTGATTTGQCDEARFQQIAFPAVELRRGSLP